MASPFERHPLAARVVGAALLLATGLALPACGGKGPADTDSRPDASPPMPGGAASGSPAPGAAAPPGGPQGAAPPERTPSAPPPAAGPAPAGPAGAAARSDAAAQAEVLHALGAAALVAARGDAAASEGATAALEDAVALDPTVVAYRVDLADAYMVADTEPSIAMAIDLYEDALEQDPENDPVRGRVVVAYQALGNHGDAWAHLERRAAGPKVNAFGAATQAAVLARVSKDLARGEAVLRALLARHAGDRVLRLFLADLLEARGDRRGARATLDAAVEGLPPNDPFVAEARTLALRWRR